MMDRLVRLLTKSRKDVICKVGGVTSADVLSMYHVLLLAYIHMLFV